MTKKEIVQIISEKMSLSQATVHSVVQETFDQIIEAMIRDRRIELRNFGVFEVKVRAARKARNPRTNEHMQVPPRLVVTFKAGKEMGDRVAALPADPEMGARLRQHLAEPPAESAPPPSQKSELSPRDFPQK